MVEEDVCNTHNKIGKIVRKAIKEAGRNYTRRLAYAPESLKQLEKGHKKSSNN